MCVAFSHWISGHLLRQLQGPPTTGKREQTHAEGLWVDVQRVGCGFRHLGARGTVDTGSLGRATGKSSSSALRANSKHDNLTGTPKDSLPWSQVAECLKRWHLRAPHHGLGWNLCEQRPESLVLNQLPPACVVKNSHSSASGADSCR